MMVFNLEQVLKDMLSAQEKLCLVHPHDKCTPCNEAEQASHVAFVEDCAKIFRGSFSELYEKLIKKGYKILKS